MMLLLLNFGSFFSHSLSFSCQNYFAFLLVPLFSFVEEKEKEDVSADRTRHILVTSVSYRGM